MHHEQARHSSRGSLVRAKAGKVTFDKHDAGDDDDLVSSPLDDLCIDIWISVSQHHPDNWRHGTAKY